MSCKNGSRFCMSLQVTTGYRISCKNGTRFCMIFHNLQYRISCHIMQNVYIVKNVLLCHAKTSSVLAGYSITSVVKNVLLCYAKTSTVFAGYAITCSKLFDEMFLLLYIGDEVKSNVLMA